MTNLVCPNCLMSHPCKCEREEVNQFVITNNLVWQNVRWNEIVEQIKNTCTFKVDSVQDYEFLPTKFLSDRLDIYGWYGEAPDGRPFSYREIKVWIDDNIPDDVYSMAGDSSNIPPQGGV